MDEQEQAAPVALEFFPLGGNILTIPIPIQEQRASGLFIPKNVKERPYQARVVAVGKGQVSQTGIRYPMEVKVGDVVLHMHFSGSKVELNEQEVLILRHDEVLGVIRPHLSREGAMDAAAAAGMKGEDAWSGYVLPPPQVERALDLDALGQGTAAEVEESALVTER